MVGQWLNKIKTRLWIKCAPVIMNKGNSTESNDYAAYFCDIDDRRYIMHEVKQTPQDPDAKVILLTLDTQEKRVIDFSALAEMKTEIHHYWRDHKITYQNIILFHLDRFTKVMTLKTLLPIMKSEIMSSLSAKRENPAIDRYRLLHLLYAEYVQQRPSLRANGMSENEILALVYGRRWYKSQLKEEHRLRTMLMVEAMVLTGELTESGHLYCIQSQAVNTLIENDNQRKADEQQARMQKTIVTCMIVLTVLLAIVILVLLSLAGIVSLPNIWQKILEYKPVRFLIKFL